MFKTLLYVLLFSSILYGCATGNPINPTYEQGTKITNVQLAKFVVGETSKEEIVSVLGGPQDTRLGDGKLILIYKYQKIASFGANEGYDVTFIFNKENILEDVMKSKGSSLPNPLTGK